MESEKEQSHDIEDLYDQMEGYYLQNIRPYIHELRDLTVIGYTFMRQNIIPHVPRDWVVEFLPTPTNQDILEIEPTGDSMHDVRIWHKDCPAMSLPE